jgi:aryl-alcohol dehydrogenase-like predicted oxidoreductase
LHKPVSNQPQYNIIRPQIETSGVIAVSEKYGLGQVVWSPLAQGMLSGKYSDGKIPKDSRAANDRINMFIKESVNDKNFQAKVAKFKQLAESMNYTASQLALAWCLRTPNVTSTITSASKPEQVIENCGAADIDFPNELENRIKEIYA